MSEHCKVGFEGTWKTGIYEIAFTATGNYWHQYQTFWEPEDWDVEDIEVEIKSIRNLETGNRLTDELEFNHNFSFEELDDFKEKIADACAEGEYEMKFPEEYYEPDDYYDEIDEDELDAILDEED